MALRILPHFLWMLLILLLILGTPLFVCMPLWCDATMYDVAARNLLQGGVHYRDVFDTNLPGIVWLHVALRSAFGWRPEVLRIADLLIVAGSAALLCRWLLKRTATRAWLPLAVFCFWFSTPEINHVQRDVWMLLPALGALTLRMRAMQGMAHPVWTVLEGALWAAACWIKPFVAIPMAMTLVISWLCRRREASAGTPALRRPFAPLHWLAGFVLIVSIGVMWLVVTGAWSHFIEVFTEWNPEYASSGNVIGMRVRNPLAWGIGAFPWSLIVVAATPLALIDVSRAWRRRQEMDAGRALLAAFFLGWLVQALVVQHPNFYVLAPLVFLGLGVLASLDFTSLTRPAAVVLAIIVAAFALEAARRHPLAEAERTGFWARCCMDGSTPELRDQLALMSPSSHGRTQWESLQQVAAYLRSRDVSDGELTCFHNATHPLYLELQLEPSTRFMQFSTVLNSFPGKREQVRKELLASRQRFVVSDETEFLLEGNEAARLRQRFPWTEPVVFASGRYRVHEVRRNAEITLAR